MPEDERSYIGCPGTTAWREQTRDQVVEATNARCARRGAVRAARRQFQPPVAQFDQPLNFQGYSPLDQVDRDNVGSLRLVWSRALATDGRQQGTPLVRDDMMFPAELAGHRPGHRRG